MNEQVKRAVIAQVVLRSNKAVEEAFAQLSAELLDISNHTFDLFRGEKFHTDFQTAGNMLKVISRHIRQGLPPVAQYDADQWPMSVETLAEGFEDFLKQYEGADYVPPLPKQSQFVGDRRVTGTDEVDIPEADDTPKIARCDKCHSTIISRHVSKEDELDEDGEEVEVTITSYHCRDCGFVWQDDSGAKTVDDLEEERRDAERAKYAAIFAVDEAVANATRFMNDITAALASPDGAKEILRRSLDTALQNAIQEIGKAHADSEYAASAIAVIQERFDKHMEEASKPIPENEPEPAFASGADGLKAVSTAEGTVDRIDSIAKSNLSRYRKVGKITDVVVEAIALIDTLAKPPASTEFADLIRKSAMEAIESFWYA